MTTNSKDMTDFSALRGSLIGSMKRFHEEAPEFGKAFQNLHKTCTKDGALDTKTKELIALAIGVAARCDGCIAFHVRDALKAGASRKAILETLEVAAFMGGGPAMMYALQAFEALGQFSEA